MGLILSILGFRRSSNMNITAATIHERDYEAEEQIGGEGFDSDATCDSETSDVSSDSDTIPGTCSSRASSDSDTSSDSDSDFEVDIGAGEEQEAGEGNLVDHDYIAQLRETKDLDIMLVCEQETGNPYWSAQAPEFPNAFGFGSSIEKASQQLQSNLACLKQSAIEENDVVNMHRIPLAPCTKDARDIRMGLQDGHINMGLKTYWDHDFEKGSTALVWGKIRV